MVTGLEGLDLATYLGVSLAFLVVLAIWSLIWKGIALWKAGRQNQLVWFVVLLLVNTLGILEILYIFWFSKMSGKRQVVAKTKKKKR